MWVVAIFRPGKFRGIYHRMHKLGHYFPSKPLHNRGKYSKYRTNSHFKPKLSPVKNIFVVFCFFFFNHGSSWHVYTPISDRFGFMISGKELNDHNNVASKIVWYWNHSLANRAPKRLPRAWHLLFMSKIRFTTSIHTLSQTWLSVRKTIFFNEFLKNTS